MVVAVNGRYADPVVDIRDEVVYIPAAASPNQELQTVPAGESWEIIGASITATTTATVGNRTFRVRVRNSAGNVFYQTAVGANLAASQTGAIQNFFLGGSPALAANVFAPAGLIVDVVDSAAVDTTNDVVSLFLIVRKYYSPVN
jgi:hypothetical protein